MPPETYTSPRTHITNEVDGGATKLIWLWAGSETSTGTIHDLCFEIRDRTQADGAVPVAVYVRDGDELVKVDLDVDEELDDAKVTVAVTRTITREERHSTVTFARGWFDS